MLEASDGSGSVITPVTVPASALPGAHTVTAVGRRTGSAAQATFTVSTDWTQIGFDAASGAQQWSTTLGGSSLSSPAVANGLVYVGSGSNLVAVNAATGAVQWAFPTGATVSASPRVAGGLVLVGICSGVLYAVDAVTSAQQWSYTTPAAITTPAVSGGLVCVASGDTVYAVSNGALVWQRTPSSGSVISIDPLVGDELVYVLAGTSITALIADTGGTRWVSGRNSRVMTTPVVDDTSLVVLDTTTQSTAPLERSFDATDGTALWSTALPVARGQYDGPLAAAGGVDHAGATDFTYAVRESDGVRLRSFATGGDRGGPAVSNGALYLPDSINGGLVRYAVPPAAARRPPRRRLGPTPRRCTRA